MSDNEEIRELRRRVEALEQRPKLTSGFATPWKALESIAVEFPTPFVVDTSDRAQIPAAYVQPPLMGVADGWIPVWETIVPTMAHPVVLLPYVHAPTNAAEGMDLRLVMSDGTTRLVSETVKTVQFLTIGGSIWPGYCSAGLRWVHGFPLWGFRTVGLEIQVQAVGLSNTSHVDRPIGGAVWGDHSLSPLACTPGTRNWSGFSYGHQPTDLTSPATPQDLSASH